MRYITCYIYLTFVLTDSKTMLQALPVQKATFNTVPTVSMATSKSIAVIPVALKTLTSLITPPPNKNPPTIPIDQIVVVQKTEAPPPTLPTTTKATTKKSETQTISSSEKPAKPNEPEILPEVSISVHAPLKRSPSQAPSPDLDICSLFLRMRRPLPPNCNHQLNGWS